MGKNHPRKKERKKLHSYQLFILSGLALQYPLVGDPLNKKLYKFLLPDDKEVGNIQASAVNTLFLNSFLDIEMVNKKPERFKLSSIGFEKIATFFKEKGIKPLDRIKEKEIKRIEQIKDTDEDLTSERYIG